jgi:hypothetical protein
MAAEAQKTTAAEGPEETPSSPSGAEERPGASQEPSAATKVGSGNAASSRDELFGVTQPSKESGPGAKSATRQGKSSSVKVRGFSQFEPTYTYASPSHWSRAVVRTQVEALGELSPIVKWKASARLDADPVYAWGDFYPDPVKRDQRLDFLVRETYLDASLGNWDMRLGRQNIVWGEVVGLFFADVVSARDLRDFILPDFQILRIPQWAARAEYFAKNDTHLELVWIPVASYDNIGQPGAEFYPFQLTPIPGVNQVILGEQRPANTLSNSNYGLRASTLKGGWDLAAFYYRSTSAAPTFYRETIIGPTPTLQYTPRHDRIWQAGTTVTKDFGGVVLRAEGVYTSNKGYEVTTPSELDGVVKQNALDYILSVDLVPFRDGRLNLQGFQRVFFDHDPGMIFDKTESGVSVLLSGKVTPKVEPSLLVIQSLNRNDRMTRLRVNWYVQSNWRLAAGIDIFDGPPTGAFGRYDNRDRVYLEARYAF